MKTSFLKTKPTTAKSDLITIFSVEGRKNVEGALRRAGFSDKFIGEIAKQMIAENFTAKASTSIELFAAGQISSKNILIAGLGKKDEIKKLSMLNLGGSIAYSAKNVGARSVAVVIDKEVSEFAKEITEGIILGNYRFLKYKTCEDDDDDKTFLKDITYIMDSVNMNALKGRIEEGKVFAKATCDARDLVNTPGSDATPSDIASEARRVAKAAKLAISVWGKNEIKKNRMGCILAVAKGSAEPPRFIRLDYKSKKKNAKHVFLVGKGVSFDAGGISLKPPRGMYAMKSDMGGAAAVLYAMEAIGRLKPNVNITALIPSVENMPDGKALKPGDIIKARNGKTIEIFSTDAEGRLILADALSFASEKKPDAIVELSTLTGGAAYCCGELYSLVMGTNDKLVSKLKDASKTCGEYMWELPIVEEYRKGYTSSTADLNNQGKSKAQTILGAIFVREFVDDKIPFAHLDIAASGWADDGGLLGPKGATGVMVRTLVEFAMNY